MCAELLAPPTNRFTVGLRYPLQTLMVLPRISRAGCYKFVADSRKRSMICALGVLSTFMRAALSETMSSDKWKFYRRPAGRPEPRPASRLKRAVCADEQKD